MLSVCVTSFNITTGAGPVNVAVSDPLYGNFVGVFAFFFWSGRTESTDAGGSATGLAGYGYCDASGNNFGLSLRDVDALGTGNTDRGIRSSCIVEQGDTAQVGWAHVASGGFTSGQMQVTIDDAFTTDMRITCWIVGGDIQAEVGTFTTATGTAPYTQTINNAGNFTPDFVLFSSAQHTTNPAQTSAIRLTLGAATATRQFAWAIANVAAGTSGDCSRFSDDSLCHAVINAGSPGSVVEAASWTSFNASPGGVTVTWSTAPALATVVGYLMLRLTNPNIKIALDSKTFRTDTTDDPVIGFGFAPRAVLAVSALTPDATVQANSKMMFGAAVKDGNQIGQAYSSRDGNTTMFVQTAIDFARLLISYDVATDLQDGLYRVKSWDGDGLTWSGDADAMPNANQFMYLAFGEVAVPNKIVAVNQARHRASYY